MLVIIIALAAITLSILPPVMIITGLTLAEIKNTYEKESEFWSDLKIALNPFKGLNDE
jgi:hypothetical protein